MRSFDFQISWIRITPDPKVNLDFLGVLGLVTSTPELNSKPDASPRNLEISKQVGCFNSGKLLQYSAVVLIAPSLEHELLKRFLMHCKWGSVVVTRFLWKTNLSNDLALQVSAEEQNWFSNFGATMDVSPFCKKQAPAQGSCVIWVLTERVSE